ncbi:hypothetical protein BC940DRAFT_301391 [Gongronella butleri]|nr:hypothetical protein BC940DRAFT_301391 [Gongronella butleri]
MRITGFIFYWFVSAVGLFSSGIQQYIGVLIFISSIVFASTINTVAVAGPIASNSEAASGESFHRQLRPIFCCVLRTGSSVPKRPMRSDS